MNYFDHAASTTIYPEVLDTLLMVLRDDFSNPGSKHVLGQVLSEKITDCRAEFLKVLGGSRQDEFIFTASATESNNTVIRGLPLIAGDVVVYSRADHPSVTVPVESLKDSGIELREILISSDGVIDSDHFLSLLDERVKLVVLTLVNNQSGVILEIDSFAKLVKEHTKAHLHVDAVQAFGKIPFKLSSSIDSMSLTSHKIGGPKGVAGLFLKQGHKVRPLLLGGGQENGLRSGTEAYPLIAGFFTAMKIVMKERDASFTDVLKLSAGIESKLKNIASSIQFPFHQAPRSPYIVSLILPGISADIILRHLEREDVFVSTTSACSSKIVGFNQTLASLKIEEKYHKNFLRISLGPKTKTEEVDMLILKFAKVWESLCSHI